ncbi:MAG: hypothetical protein AAF519_03670, partial [Bacteroidota bacterium]
MIIIYLLNLICICKLGPGGGADSYRQVDALVNCDKLKIKEVGKLIGKCKVGPGGGADSYRQVDALVNCDNLKIKEVGKLIGKC